MTRRLGTAFALSTVFLAPSALWETPANEPSIWDPAVAGGFAAFSQRMTARFHAAGRKVVAGAINSGWPRLPSEDGGAMMRLVAKNMLLRR